MSAADPSAETTAPDYKSTLRLPKTDFPMKGNLAQLEPRLLEQWKERNTFAAMVEKRAGAPKFVLHDGPPYANGHLHAGHALNKILKDIVVKYRGLSGRLADYIPGWDTHGLPIEQAVEKRLREKKIDKRALSRDEFLEKCRDYATEFIAIQREEFERLGVLGRWESPYRTLSFDYEAQEIRELAIFAKRGNLYRKKKPVYFCITDQTALAEAEVEYEDHDSPSVYVAMDAGPELYERLPNLKGRKVAFAIWTTTPWTLPANLAIAVHSTVEYAFYDVGQRVLVVAKELLPAVLSAISGAKEPVAVDPQKVLAVAQGSSLEGVSYRHPFYDRVSKLVLGEHVTLEAGTGLVHTAPGHGQEDYEVGLVYGLDVYNPVKNDGRYDDSVGERLAGKKIFEANPLVIEWLVENGALLNPATDKVRHSYPHCWRCHNPIVFRATHQWFVSLAENNLRQKALAEIDRVQWIPRWGHDRIYNMLEGRPDWTISRQRTWGVPIPVALCDGCDQAYVSAPMMEKVADAVAKEGVGVWYRTDVTEYLPSKDFACPNCHKHAWRRETDILDVWFDSACSFAAVAEKEPNLSFPADLYLEGSDQHRGWFHSSLLVSVGTRDVAPYKAVLTHGFVVDGDGRKMSKSVGNVVAPEKVINQYGAEILRLWVASSDYRDDVRLSDQILKGLSEAYRKIRNTLRYALSNLFDFDPAKDSVPADKLTPLDSWARGRLAGLVQKVTQAYEDYEFHRVHQAVVDFCAMDLSAVYFDILKDRLYTARADGLARRSSQTVIYEIAHSLLVMLAPIMSFTAEEAFGFLPGEKEASVFFADFPKVRALSEQEIHQAALYEKLFSVRTGVQGLLEIARRDKKIGSSLEAKVVLSASGEIGSLLKKHLPELPALLIVSQVELADASSFTSTLVETLAGPVGVEVKEADGNKCPRCWTYSVKVGHGQDVCDKCVEALS